MLYNLVLSVSNSLGMCFSYINHTIHVSSSYRIEFVSFSSIVGHKNDLEFTFPFKQCFGQISEHKLLFYLSMPMNYTCMIKIMKRTEQI